MRPDSSLTRIFTPPATGKRRTLYLPPLYQKAPLTARAGFSRFWTISPEGSERGELAEDWDMESERENTDERLTCAQCGARASLEDAERDGWSLYSDGTGELLPFCAECSRREFGSTS